jgi:hypothetical protein
MVAPPVRRRFKCALVKWRTRHDSNEWPLPSERGASVPMANRTVGRCISLQTRELLAGALRA